MCETRNAVAHANGGSEEQPASFVHELTRKCFKR